jgi:hypothetical protein
MTPPLCIHCHQRPVRRARSNEWPKCGTRTIDGVRWRWSCSPACNGHLRAAKDLHSPRSREAIAKNRATNLQKRLDRYIAACRDVMTTDGLVPIKEMVRFMAQIERAGYARGWQSAIEYARTGMRPRDLVRKAKAAA